MKIYDDPRRPILEVRKLEQENRFLREHKSRLETSIANLEAQAQSHRDQICSMLQMEATNTTEIAQLRGYVNGLQVEKKYLLNKLVKLRDRYKKREAELTAVSSAQQGPSCITQPE